VTDARAAVRHRLERLTREWAGEQAIQFEGRWLTWGDVGNLADRLDAILDEQGTDGDAVVAVVMRQRPALLAAELSALRAGRTAFLMSALQADRALAADIFATRPAVVVAHPRDWERAGFAAAVVEGGALGIEVDDRLAASVRITPDIAQPGPSLDAAATVLTSGTTGPPKRLPVAWESFVRLGDGPDGRVPVSGRGALILGLPLVTLGGLLSVTRLVFGGRPLSMMERFDVHAWAALVKEHRPKVIGAPPPVVKMILDAGITPDHFEGVTAYMTSSASIPPDVIRRFEHTYGFPVLLGYGATEFLSSVTGWTPALWDEFGARKVGSVGRALPGVQLRVVDADSGEQLASDESGVLEVDPPERAVGLPAGWLRTSDRARLDPDGFLWILGRVDDVIVRGGFKIDVTQIETALLEHPAVSGATSIGIPDERVGQVPAAVVTINAGATAPSESELIEWVRERVAAYAAPVTVRVVDIIPTTTTLKPHRAAIAELLADR
jgi:acyl-CoA synthetase (AMP-forming)/AMP-acid ligase II